MYDIEVTGYEGRTNKLHLFDVETLDESLIKDGTISFDKTDIAKNLTLFLYPDDKFNCLIHSDAALKKQTDQLRNNH